MSDARPAEATDLSLLAAVEAAADALVVEALACDPALFAEVSTGEQRAAEPGFLLVAGRPVVGFAHVLEEDGGAHCNSWRCGRTTADGGQARCSSRRAAERPLDAGTPISR